MPTKDKVIQLIRLTLKGFKGMYFVFDPKGKDADVFGANESGKTTLTDAFHWLLFDKDSLGHSDFQIKTIVDKLTGETVHNEIHSVEGVLLDDEEVVTLKKEYYEVWTTPRGKATAICTGHTTDYFIDGLKKPKKDYTALIKKIAGDEATFRLLTSPETFPALEWKKARDIIMSFNAEVTDAAVIESDSSLAALTEIVGKKKMDDVRALIKERQKNISDEKAKIPIRIDEQKRMMPDMTGLDLEVIDREITRIEADLTQSKLRLAGIDNGSKITELSKAMAGVNAKITEMESAHFNNVMNTVNKLNQEHFEVSQSMTRSKDRLLTIDGDIQRKQTRSEGLDEELGKIRAKWALIEDETFEMTPFLNTIENSCVTCGQLIPAEQVNDAMEKALADYNLRKAKKLAEFNEDKADRQSSLVSRGKTMKEEKEKLRGEIVALQEEFANIKASLPATSERLQLLESDIRAAKEYSLHYEDLEGRNALIATLTMHQAAIEREQEGSPIEEEDTLKAEIATLETSLTSEKEKAERFVTLAKNKKRIAELLKEEDKLKIEFEKLANDLYLTDQFIKRKCDMISESVNSMFEFVRFKLFEVLVNGNVNDQMCEIMVKGVPYNKNLNNAGQIQAGLDIVRTLQKFYHMHSTVFVDNRESVSKIPKMECQVISLYVSEPDKVLRVEVAA